MNSTLMLVTNALAIVLIVKAATNLVGDPPWRGRPVPWWSFALSACVAVPSLTQQVWPALLGLLDRDPEEVTHHGQVWRLLTAAFVQDGGVPGTIFNLVTIVIVAALAEWYWGGRVMAATFLAAAVLFNAQGVAFDSAGAGNSGATFALGASLAAALAISRTGRDRLQGVLVPLVGVVMTVLGNYHGQALVYGFVIGVVLWALTRRGNRMQTQSQPTTERRAS